MNYWIIEVNRYAFYYVNILKSLVNQPSYVRLNEDKKFTEIQPPKMLCSSTLIQKKVKQMRTTMSGLMYMYHGYLLQYVYVFNLFENIYELSVWKRGSD